MKILYITNLTNSNICELTLKPHMYAYYYGLIKILGRENIKLTNINNITSHINTIEEFDYILITRDLLFNFYTRIAIENIIKKYKGKVFAIMDHFDPLPIDKIIHSPNIKCYFKREVPNVYLNKEILKRYTLGYFSVKNSINLFLIKKYLATNKLIPLPLTYHILEDNACHLDAIDKRYSVSFIANLHPAIGNLFGKFYQYEIWKERIKIAEICKKVPNSYVRLNYAGFRGGLPLKEYYSIIKSSYTSMNVIGSGFDTFRRYEIPYMGTVLISKKLPIIIPNDFIHGVHAFFYENTKELKTLLQEILKNKDELVEMGRRAREHVLKYHSPEARARIIINALTQ